MEQVNEGVIKVMKCFTVQDDGEITPIEVTSYEDLADDQVYLLVDHSKKHIFIWKGRNAPVRRKFISARTAQSMRNELGLTYKVISVEQGNETKTFGTLMKGLEGSVGDSGASVRSSGSSVPGSSAIEKPSGPQLVPKVIPDSARASSPSLASSERQVQGASPQTASPSASPGPKVAPVATPRSIPRISLDADSSSPTSASVSPPASSIPPVRETAGARSVSVPDTAISRPSTVPRATSVSPSSPPRQTMTTVTATPDRHLIVEPQPQPVSSEVSEDQIKKVTELLEKMGKVPGMVREIVVIGDTIFTVLTEHLKLFNKEIVKLEPMEGLPDGLFPAPEYYTRLYVENGKVLFIELFKEEPVDERSEFIDEMKRSLRDLTKLGL